MSAKAAETTQAIWIVSSLVLEVLYHGRNNRPVQRVAHTQLRSRLLPACLPVSFDLFACLNAPSYGGHYHIRTTTHAHEHTNTLARIRTRTTNSSPWQYQLVFADCVLAREGG